ncbi:hypothetical protein ACFL6S_14240 [Candidatus Poribacteria bacterium]
MAAILDGVVSGVLSGIIVLVCKAVIDKAIRAYKNRYGSIRAMLRHILKNLRVLCASLLDKLPTSIKKAIMHLKKHLW